MTEWIDFAVYATLHAMLWFLVPLGVARSGLLAVADRNASWLAAHPDTVAKLMRGGPFISTSFALGAISLALLAACQLGLWPRALSAPALEPERWMVLKDLNSALALPVLAFYFGSSILFRRWLRTVPLAEQRDASLVPRSIDSLIPRPFRIATYFAIGAHLAAWVAAGAWLTYAMPDLWSRNFSQFGGAALAFVATHAVFLWVTRVCVERRPGTLDRLFGPGYRRKEVRTVFALNWLPPLTGTLRLVDELGNDAVDFGRLSHLLLALAVVVLFVVAARPKSLGHPGEYRQAPLM